MTETRTLERIHQCLEVGQMSKKLANDVRKAFDSLLRLRFRLEFAKPESEHEEAWWQLVHLAYLQLWVARHLAHCLPRPWERNLPAMKTRLASPTLVQRDFGRIIRQLGTPAQPPKPRGYCPGWPPGRKRKPRQRHPVVVKGKLLENSP